MAEGPTVESAMRRLAQALGGLEVAAMRQIETSRGAAELEEEIARLADDRSRLAQDLDKEQARAVRLEEANRDVSRRLIQAMESIRTVLDAHGG